MDKNQKKEKKGKLGWTFSSTMCQLDMSPLMNQVRPYYPNAYAFSMALAEQVLVNDVRKKQLSNFQQFPIGILRLGHIGPSVCEPLKGWVRKLLIHSSLLNHYLFIYALGWRCEWCKRCDSIDWAWIKSYRYFSWRNECWCDPSGFCCPNDHFLRCNHGYPSHWLCPSNSTRSNARCYSGKHILNTVSWNSQGFNIILFINRNYSYFSHYSNGNIWTTFGVIFSDFFDNDFPNSNLLPVYLPSMYWRYACN